MTEHTPGPWTLETVETSCGLCHKIGPFPWREGKPNHACIYVDHGHWVVADELLANARLIAAAPENAKRAHDLANRVMVLEAEKAELVEAGNKLSYEFDQYYDVDDGIGNIPADIMEMVQALRVVIAQVGRGVP